MEIHAPDRHIQSFRDIGIHLAIVTVGILIALGLEQAVEWYHHRKLVAEAKENILSEIRDNKKELDKQTAMLPEFRAAAVQALDLITDLQQHGKSDIKNLHLNFYQAQLRGTSWTTAQTMGALALMSYSEVNKYAAAYSFQDDYVARQNRTEETGVAAYSVFSARNKLEKLSSSEYEAERAKLMLMVSALTVEIQGSHMLNRAYEAILSGKSEPGASEHQSEH